MMYRARPWKGRKPAWASAAEVRAESEWLRVASAAPDMEWASDAESAWYEPGAPGVMNATSGDIDALARMQDAYVLEAYVRGVQAGTIEEHPGYPVTTPR